MESSVIYFRASVNFGQVIKKQALEKQCLKVLHNFMSNPFFRSLLVVSYLLRSKIIFLRFYNCS